MSDAEWGFADMELEKGEVDELLRKLDRTRSHLLCLIEDMELRRRQLDALKELDVLK